MQRWVGGSARVTRAHSTSRARPLTSGVWNLGISSALTWDVRRAVRCVLSISADERPWWALSMRLLSAQSRVPPATHSGSTRSAFSSSWAMGEMIHVTCESRRLTSACRSESKATLPLKRVRRINCSLHICTAARSAAAAMSRSEEMRCTAGKPESARISPAR